MVEFSLTIAAGVGIIVSALYIMWELGHYATPQVAENRFDERREIFAYTAGLFIGILAVLPFLLFLVSFGNGSLLGTLLFLTLVVLVVEVAQWAIRRTRYWGHDTAFPFYAIGLRCGIAGLLMTGLFAQYLEGPLVTWDGLTVLALDGLAILWLLATTALLSLPADPRVGRRSGGPLPAGAVLFVGFFLVGFNAFAGELIGAVAALLALAVAIYLYAQLRPILDRIRPIPLPSSAATIPSRFARTDSPDGDVPKRP
ncbi:MAG: hypothetical protein ACREBZ_04350 [Thermoplasmata archaeon]